MGKNIMLASINEGGIKNLSIFTMIDSKKAVLQARYLAVKTACERVLKSLEAEAKIVRVITKGKRKGEKVYTYGTRGIVVLDEIYNTKSARLTLKQAVDIRSYLLRIEAQLKNETRKLEKEYNESILAIVPEGAYKAYLYGMETGSYYHNEKNDFSLAYYVSRTCERLGFLNAKDKKATDKFTESLLVYFGANARRARIKDGVIKSEACIKAMSETAFNRLYVEGIIERLKSKAVLKLTGKGYIKLTKEEAQAQLAKKTA